MRDLSLASTYPKQSHRFRPLPVGPGSRSDSINCSISRRMRGPSFQMSIGFCGS